MTDPTLEEAVEQCQEALGGLRDSERELGWALAREKIGILGFLLDDMPEQAPRMKGDTITDPRD